MGRGFEKSSSLYEKLTQNLNLAFQSPKKSIPITTFQRFFEDTPSAPPLLFSDSDLKVY